MATCLLWRPATLTKTEKNRNTELLFYQVFAFINEVFFIYLLLFFSLFRHEPDAIFIRTVNEVEVKPKPKALAAPPQ
jgi:hypothetical protein